LNGVGLNGSLPGGNVGGDCDICSKSFGILKKAKVCGECGNAVCGSCSGNYKLPGWSSSRVICSTCIPGLVGSCGICDQEFSTRHRKVECVECHKTVGSGAGCSQTKGASFALGLPSGSLCKNCESTVDLRGRRMALGLSTGVPRPIVEGDYDLEEQKMIIGGGGTCSACSKTLEAKLGSGAARCSMCSSTFCTSCCGEFREAGAVLKEKEPFISCGSCWSGVKGKLGGSPACSADVAFGDALFDDKIVDLPMDLGMGVGALKNKTCGECEGPFNTFRPAAKCTNCEKLICNGELCGGLFMSPSVAEGKRFPLCGTCAPKVMLGVDGAGSKLNLGKAKKWFGKLGGGGVGGGVGAGGGGAGLGLDVKPELEGAALSPSAQSSLALKGTGCEICHRRYGKIRTEAGTCSACAKGACVACLGDYSLPSIGVDSQPLCTPCVTGLQGSIAQDGGLETAQGRVDMNRVSLGPLRAATDLNLDAEEQSLMAVGGLNCSVCSAKLGLNCPAARCGVCRGLCDRTHVKDLPLYSRLTSMEGPVCKVCWPNVRTDLAARTHSQPKLKTAADLELAAGDAWAGMPLVQPAPLDVSGGCSVCKTRFHGDAAMPDLCAKCGALHHAPGCGAVMTDPKVGGSHPACMTCVSGRGGAGGGLVSL
jgi:hypothetical protein